VSFLIRILLLLVATAAQAQEPPVVVGAVVSQTGMLAPLAGEYRKGLEVWLDDVNGAGGLLGRRVELRLLDDGSDAVRAGALYREMIQEGRTDLLIGPFGSAATLMAGAEAERARRVMINGAGPSRTVHRRGTRYVFQTAVPNTAYGDGVVAIARAAGLRRLFILTRDDLTSREMAEAVRDAATRQGLEPAPLVVYSAGADDFAPQIQKARAAGAEAWIAFGGLRDAADMVRSLKRLLYAPPLFFARSAADPRLISIVGQDAESSLGATEYETRFPTPGNDRFVRAFRAKYSTVPGATSAHGFAAGMVLAEAVRRAGSLDQEKLRAVLAVLETNTVLGGHKVDPESGAQLAATAAVVQILKGRPEVLWPEWLQTATFEPYLPWAERKLLE
jgi:branched-chain amino acid transport system substrate-binding protein